MNSKEAGNSPERVSSQSDANQDRATPRPLRRFVIKVLRIAGFGYATVLVTLVVMETRLIYPGAYLRTGTVQASPMVQTVEYESTDGVALQGRLLHRDSSKPIVLYFHGNGEKAVWLDRWLIQLADQFDANVMAAEYRGYADNAPKPDEQGVLADCRAARQYLIDSYDVQASDIILYGRSLGGGCAVALAADGGAEALVLERTFDRLVDVAAGRYPVIPVRWLMRNQYDSMARIAHYDGPLIQLHGADDRLIPITHAKRLFDSSKSTSKEFLEVPGLAHNDFLSANLLAQIAARVNASVKK